MLQQFATIGLSVKEGLSLTPREFYSYQKGYAHRIAYENIANVYLINMKQAQLSKSPKFVTSSELFGAIEKNNEKERKINKLNRFVQKIRTRKNSKKGGKDGK